MSTQDYHCCAELLTLGFSFYVASSYSQHSDDIQEHLRHIEKVLYSLRVRRLIDANARSLCSTQNPYECVQVEESIQEFGLNVVNDAVQPLTYWTKGSSYIYVTLVSRERLRFDRCWRVKNFWTSSDRNAVVLLLTPKPAVADRRAESDM